MRPNKPHPRVKPGRILGRASVLTIGLGANQMMPYADYDNHGRRGLFRSYVVS
jgi:hypothetical protein